MSRVESPFHAIAAEALGDFCDVSEPGADGFTAASVPQNQDAKGQERDSTKPSWEPKTDNGGNEALGKNRVLETHLLQKRTVSTDGGVDGSEIASKKSKKRMNVWSKTTSRKSAKKVKTSGVRQSEAKDDNVLLKPFHQEDDPSYPILLSKIYKAEKIELSADRLTASGSKGYRMVRATRAVVEGAWYFEIYVERLGGTGHTRLGWSTRRGDLQAPVGYDTHSYSYRDLDGCKVHAAVRQEYGEAYHEKDVIGFYINLPREPGFTRQEEEEVVGYKGQPYVIVVDEPIKSLPGSEILFFKNGVCQGVAFKDVNDGSYFPAASMYTLPTQDCCKVVFNFGPHFKYPLADLGDRPFPSPMCQASGPGEVRAESVPTSHAETIMYSVDTVAGKWMASEHGDLMEVEQAKEAAAEENTDKADEMVPPVAKEEVKKPKVAVRNHIPPPLFQKSKLVISQLSPESRSDVNPSQDWGKREKETGRPYPVGIQREKGWSNLRMSQKHKGLQSFEGIQKVKVTLDSKGIQKDKGPPNFKGSKKYLSGTDKSNSEEAKEDRPVSGLLGTTLSATPGFKVNKNDAVGPGVTSLKGIKKDLPGMGSPNLEGIENDLTVAGSESIKGRKRALCGLIETKSIRRDIRNIESTLKITKGVTGTGSELNSSKHDFLRTGSALKPSRVDLRGTGSGLKSRRKGLSGPGTTEKTNKRDDTGSGYFPRELDSSKYSGGRSWGDGVRGTTMDVDVVVVESSLPPHAGGPVRAKDHFEEARTRNQRGLVSSTLKGLKNYQASAL